MAEVQSTTVSGEMTLRFIEFVRLHSQNAAFCLGLIPHPQTGKPEANLALARMLIDQLAAIAFKTKGNLTSDEETVINNALSHLQMAYVEAQKNEKKSVSEAAQ
ncbi:MAG: DUF1844 domain-containing protein [Verrucomicrobia bacterium]|nr:DUF1844 domain-containing protein [Verrucomicrobiota bacterium]